MYRLKLTNQTDADNAQAGLLAAERVRSLELEAELDPRATLPALPMEVVAALGLPIREWRPVRRADGTSLALAVVRGLDLELAGRGMTSDAFVLPPGHTPLIGRRQLAALVERHDEVSRLRFG